MKKAIVVRNDHDAHGFEIGEVVVLQDIIGGEGVDTAYVFRQEEENGFAQFLVEDEFTFIEEDGE